MKPGIAARTALLLGAVALTTELTTTLTARMPNQIHVTTAKHVDFSRFKTYEWISLPVTEPARHTMAAVDRELAAAGLTRVDTEPGDLLVGAVSISRTHVDVHADRQGSERLRPEYRIGILVVKLQDPATGAELFRGRADIPVDIDTAQVHATIDDVVARIFLRYPHRGPNPSVTRVQFK